MSVLSEILRTKLIPWAQQDAGQRFIVARPKMRDKELPSGVHLTRRNLTGKRNLVKSRRNYNNIRNIIAEWPTDGLHELNKYAMVCVLDGYIDYPLGSYKLKCGSGHFIFIPPGTPHPNGTQPYVDMQRCSSCNIVTFILHPNAVECWMSHGHSQGRERSNSCLILHERAISLFQALVEELVEDEERALMVGQGLLLAFVNVLQREADAGRLQYTYIKTPNYQMKAASEDIPQAEFATRLEHYVRANLHKPKPLTLERVSREMYLSPAQFARRVRRETGDTYNQLLTRYRIEDAKALLRDSEWSVSTISWRVGFQSSSYFCAFFKQHTGETPGEFRARSMKEVAQPKR